MKHEMEYDLGSLKVAIVHDWLVTNGGDVRVLEQIINCFPQADLFATIDFLPQEHRKFLRARPVKTSFLQSLPGVQRNYWYYIALMPLAVEQFDLSDYDLIISSSHAVAKGVIVNPDQLHVSYIHSPMRFAWDLQSYYLQNFGMIRGLKGAIARLIFHYLRLWDYRSAQSVDCLIANSQFVSRRILKTYRREARVIYPPVNIESFKLGPERESFYLTAGFMNPFKKIDLIVEAFRKLPQRKLIVIGTGPDEARIRSKAGSNVTFLGYQTLEMLVHYLQRCQAFLYAAPEDFGILIAEAQACGTPVIGYAKGGAREIIQDLTHECPTGVLFESQSVDAIVNAVTRFEDAVDQIHSTDCRENTLRFSPEQFCSSFMSCVQQEWLVFKESRGF